MSAISGQRNLSIHIEAQIELEDAILVEAKDMKHIVVCSVTLRQHVRHILFCHTCTWARTIEAMLWTHNVGESRSLIFTKHK